MKLPFVAAESLCWKLEITQLDPQIEWVLYRRQISKDPAQKYWVEVKPAEQYTTLNDVVSHLLKEKFVKEDDRFLPTY